MAGAFSGHLLDSFESSMVSQGNMSFNPNMHGTQQTSQPFSMFNSQGTMAFQELSEATAIKIAALQSKLNQKLGPEYISQRPGPGGGPKLTYAEGWKIINLANDVFGFNGWSSSIVNVTTDFIDVHPETKRCNISVTAIVRVTLRDGVYHEDLGHGLIENSKSKGQGLAKCKKEAVTDGVKRALRNFGNLLGNCLYDKSYAQEVVKIKVPPAKFNPNELHRRPEFDDVKPNVASTSSATASHARPGPSTNSTSTSASTSYSAPPSPPQTTSGSTSVAVKKEPAPQSVSFSTGAGHRPPQQPPYNRPMPPPPVPAHAHAPQNADRRVSFTIPSTSNGTSTSAAAPLDADDSFSGFSDDDAFLASVDLDGDLGAPIGGEEDMGQPIDADTDMGQPLYDDDSASVASVSRPQTPAPVSRPAPPPPNANGQGRSRPSDPGRSSRLEAIIAAQLEQDRINAAQQNGSSSNTPTSTTSNHPQAPSRITLPPRNNSENRDPGSGQQHSNPQSKTPTPVGGFHFPPGVNNPMQGQNHRVHASGSGSGVGMKRPLSESVGPGGQRGTRPGMGLQHAAGGSGNEAGVGGRQVLGRLDVGESGDVKRMRM